jgi:hypothetical protein
MVAIRREDDALTSFKQIGTGLSFIVLPLVFVFAFAVHPGLLQPGFLTPSELITRAHGAGLLQFGHALVTLNTALLVVVAIHFMRVLQQGPGAWAGFVGAALAVLGALSLAADKGALCLTMSSFEGLTDSEFAGMMPGLVAMFSMRGWLVLLWGIMLLPIGFGIQAIALLKWSSIPRWQSILFLVGVIFIGTPDGVEIVNLTAALLLSAALIPYGINLLQGMGRRALASGDA